MEVLGRELALSISVGPSPGLRRELRELFPQGTALRIQLIISAGDVAAETPNIIALSEERWQLRLCPQAGDSSRSVLLSPPRGDRPQRPIPDILQR